MTTLTRRYRFSASHRLHVSTMGEAENQRVFGKCNNPCGHGHDYVLSVTVGGAIDPATGLIVRRARLDEFVESAVLRLVAHRNLNRDLPQFAELVPTTENLALVIAELLETDWSAWFGKDSSAHLSRIHVQETDRNGFEVLLASRRRKIHSAQRFESVTIHA